MFVSVKRFFLGAAIGMSLATAPFAHAKDMQVPLQKCASPAGSIAVDTSSLGIWRSVRINDPSEFLMAIATDSNCFTPASSVASATYRITAGPISKSEFNAGVERFSGRTSLMGAALSKPSRMVWAHVAITDRSGQVVAQGFGRNNTSKLDYSQWASADRGVLRFNSNEVSRKHGGAMLNAFGEARPAVERSLRSSSVAQSSSPSSAPYASAPRASAPSIAGSSSAVTVKELLSGRSNNLAFQDRFRFGENVQIKGYAGPIDRIRMPVGNCPVGDKDPNCSGFKRYTDGVSFNVMDGPDISSLVTSAIVCKVVGGSEQARNFSVGDPIVVSGKFALIEPVVGLPKLGTSDCRIEGTWEPGKVTDRMAVGGAQLRANLPALLSEADSNNFAFSQRYMGKRVAVTGPVSNISQADNGMINIALKDPSRSGNAAIVSCQVPPSQGSKAASLSKGSNGTLIGTVVKPDSYLPILVSLRDCELQ